MNQVDTRIIRRVELEKHQLARTMTSFLEDPEQA
jgi:hypothetical protein